METEWECRGRARSHHVCVMLWVFNGSLFSVWTLGVWDITMVSPFIKVSVCGGWERFTAVTEAACCTWLLGSLESLGKTPRWQQYYHGLLGVKGCAVFPHLWIDSLVMWPVADVRFFFLERHQLRPSFSDFLFIRTFLPICSCVFMLHVSTSVRNDFKARLFVGGWICLHQIGCYHSKYFEEVPRPCSKHSYVNIWTEYTSLTSFPPHTTQCGYVWLNVFLAVM